MDLPALPEGQHLDWNFTLELEDGQRPEGLPAPSYSQLSCKDRALSENGNRVDGRVTFPAVKFPHKGGTARYHCDAQVAPPANLPLDVPIDPLADFANLHSDLFDINAQMDFEYPNSNRRNGWWAVSVCMEHWENIGTEENPEKRFFRKRCAKKRLYITKAMILEYKVMLRVLEQMALKIDPIPMMVPKTVKTSANGTVKATVTKSPWMKTFSRAPPPSLASVKPSPIRAAVTTNSKQISRLASRRSIAAI